MHEVQGVFCKTGSLWIIRKIADLEKKPTRAESNWPNSAKGGLGGSPRAKAQSVEREACKGTLGRGQRVKAR